MKDTRLEDYSLEVRLLQEKDCELAAANGITTKEEWFEHIIAQDNDPTALHIISLADRYDIPVTNAANDFDPSMVIRVGKIFKDNKAFSKK